MGIAMLKLFFCLLSLLFTSLSIAGTIDPNTDDSKYIEYGSKFHCIYRISGSYSDNTPYTASCVVIDPEWILTAAHVVDKSSISFVHDNGEQVHLVDRAICHEAYESRKYGYHDIALCHLSNKIILNFYPKLYDSKDEVGKICSMSGYGLTGTFLTGIHISDKHRRAGSNKIEYIDRKLLICTPSSINKTELEFLIGIGDSGGGLFIDGKLAGINSCVISDDGKTNSSYADESGHTRISEYIEWINNTMNGYKNEKKK